MKHAAITFAFTACLLSSLAFADNPTDAPLMPADGNSITVQQEKCAGANRRHPNRMDKSGSPRAGSEDPSKKNRQGKQRNADRLPASNG
jgi:hypothetical protein